ncbi:unnamed protein product [Closterium sp. NIES-65]|nr:unnamed protein product [Closterium sp. NIES-65]
MVHYVDVSGGWDAGECDWCFDRAVAYRAADALGEGVTSFLVHLHRDQSPAIPRAPPSRPTRVMLDFSWNVPVQRIRGQQGGLGGQQGRQGGQQGGMGGQQRRQGEQQGMSPREQLVWKCEKVPLLCVQAMLLEWMAEPRVAQLGAGRQVENDCFASMLVQVLGVKESAHLQEGFGALMQNLLTGGLEKTDAEGRSSAGEGEGEDGGSGGVERGGGNGGSNGKGEQWRREHLKGREWERYVNDPVIGLLTYRVARILQWLRIYGSDSISAKSCFKDSPRGKVLPMRHPLRDLPSLLVRFGAVLPPLDGGSRLAEWEEWPEGDEAAVKFPVDASARCFELGRRNSSLGRKNRGHEATQQQGKSSTKAPTEEAPAFPSECYPIVRCKADADYLVEILGVFLKAPACAQCSTCISRFVSLVPVVALIANFAYLPAAALLDCVLSVFPPHTEEFLRLLKRMGLAVPPTPVSVSLSSLSATRSRLLELMEDVNFFRISFLLHTAPLCSTSLLEQIRPEGQQSLLVGGECRVVWEEVQSWLIAVMLPVDGVGVRGAACSGSQSRKEDLSARMEEVTEMYLSVHCSSSSSSIFSKQTSKEGNEPDYLKAWPGGVNLFACLREMLLGEPCYRPAASAAYSIPSAASRHTAAVAPDVQGHVCGAAGCGTVEGGGVKLRICGACGKVAYCSRECQKAHWPSHKLTCPGRTSGKRSGKNSSKVSGNVSGRREVTFGSTLKL